LKDIRSIELAEKLNHFVLRWRGIAKQGARLLP
jgi:hypothetical protein